MNIQGYELTDYIGFGKYKGQKVTIEYLIEYEIGYMQWLVENQKIDLSDEAFEYYQEELENGGHC